MLEYVVQDPQHEYPRHTITPSVTHHSKSHHITPLSCANNALHNDVLVLAAGGALQVVLVLLQGRHARGGLEVAEALAGAAAATEVHHVAHLGHGGVPEGLGVRVLPVVLQLGLPGDIQELVYLLRGRLEGHENALSHVAAALEVGGLQRAVLCRGNMDTK